MKALPRPPSRKRATVRCVTRRRRDEDDTSRFTGASQARHANSKAAPRHTPARQLEYPMRPAPWTHRRRGHDSITAVSGDPQHLRITRARLAHAAAPARAVPDGGMAAWPMPRSAPPKNGQEVPSRNRRIHEDRCDIRAGTKYSRRPFEWVEGSWPARRLPIQSQFSRGGKPRIASFDDRRTML
jgi:hypothetical protein